MFLSQGATADNAVASVSVTAPTGGAKVTLLSIDADYSATVNAIRTVTLKHESTSVFIWRWDFSLGPFQRNVAYTAPSQEAVSVELQASGTGGTTGRVGVGYTQTNVPLIG